MTIQVRYNMGTIQYRYIEFMTCTSRTGGEIQT